MSGEMFTAAILSFGLIFVGIIMGYLLLKVQGDPEENLREGRGLSQWEKGRELFVRYKVFFPPPL